MTPHRQRKHQPRSPDGLGTDSQRRGGERFVRQPRTPREGKDASGYGPPRKGRVAAVIFLGVGKTGTSALQQPLRHVGPAGKPPAARTPTKPFNDLAACVSDGQRANPSSLLSHPICVSSGAQSGGGQLGAAPGCLDDPVVPPPDDEEARA